MGYVLYVFGNATSKKNVKSHVFLDFQQNVKNVFSSYAVLQQTVVWYRHADHRIAILDMNSLGWRVWRDTVDLGGEKLLYRVPDRALPIHLLLQVPGTKLKK